MHMKENNQYHDANVLRSSFSFGADVRDLGVGNWFGELGSAMNTVQMPGVLCSSSLPKSGPIKLTRSRV